jgi:hypothetical protein
MRELERRATGRDVRTPGEHGIKTRLGVDDTFSFQRGRDIRPTAAEPPRTG